MEPSEEGLPNSDDADSEGTRDSDLGMRETWGEDTDRSTVPVEDITVEKLHPVFESELSVLTGSKWITDQTIKTLYDNNFTTLRGILQAGSNELAQCSGIGERTADRIYRAAMRSIDEEGPEVGELEQVPGVSLSNVVSLIEEEYTTFEEVVSLGPSGVDAIIDAEYPELIDRIFVYSVWEVEASPEQQELFESLRHSNVANLQIKQVILYGFDSVEKIAEASLHDLVESGKLDRYDARNLRRTALAHLASESPNT